MWKSAAWPFKWLYPGAGGMWQRMHRCRGTGTTGQDRKWSLQIEQLWGLRLRCHHRGDNNKRSLLQSVTVSPAVILWHWGHKALILTEVLNWHWKGWEEGSGKRSLTKGQGDTGREWRGRSSRVSGKEREGNGAIDNNIRDHLAFTSGLWSFLTRLYLG